MSGRGGGKGSVHVRLAQTAPSRMNSTLIVTPLNAGQRQLILAGIMEEGSS